MNQSKQQYSQRVIPNWVWFLIGNVVVVIAIVVGVLVWLNRQGANGQAAIGTSPNSTIANSKAEVEAATALSDRPNDSADKAAATFEIAIKDAGDKSAANEAPAGAANGESTSASNDKPNLIAEVMRGVVFIKTLDSKGELLTYGTGFLFQADGLIATNFHVLQNCSSAVVEFEDKQQAKVIGVHAWSDLADLAVLKVDRVPANAQVLKLSSEKTPDVGRDVFSIGNPSQFRFVTTRGILNGSYPTRELPKEIRASIEGDPSAIWLQHSATINRGSSGGPLFDSEGVVIGINTWMSEQFGFAQAIHELDSLLKHPLPSLMTLESLTGPGEELATMIQETQVEWGKFQTNLQRSLPTEVESILKADHPMIKLAPKFLDWAEANKGNPNAERALQGVALLCIQTQSPDSLASEMARCATLFSAESAVLKKHGFRSLLWGLRSYGSPLSTAFLKEIIQQCDDRTIKGLATFSLACGLSVSEDEQDLEQSLALLKKVKVEFADVTYDCPEIDHPIHSLAKECEEPLYRLNHLRLGMAAMEIVGKDVEGNEVRLSSLKGKVVLLDFWASWCPPCRSMFATQRALVKKYGDKPFVWLGVCTDDLKTIQGLMDDKKIACQNIVDAGETISQQWRVEGIPELYLIDANGIIRKHHSGVVDRKQLTLWIDEQLQSLSGPQPPLPIE